MARLRCMELPSATSSCSLPSLHNSSRLSRLAASVLLFEFLFVCCRSNVGMSIAAFKESSPCGLSSANPCSWLAISVMNSFPTLPRGTKDRFVLQFATSRKASRNGESSGASLWLPDGCSVAFSASALSRSFRDMFLIRRDITVDCEDCVAVPSSVVVEPSGSTVCM